MFIGTAGWTIPSQAREAFPEAGSHLARYAQVLSAVEINSTFYRSHKPETFVRWAEMVPPHFRFALKMPQTITHDRRLAGTKTLLKTFLDESSGLGEKRGPILIQLPGSFAHRASTLAHFFDTLRRLYEGPVAFEPRHPSWFLDEVSTHLQAWNVARVVADPVRGADAPGGTRSLVYYRLHGSPRMYYSEYDHSRIMDYARRLSEAAAEAWCIFDNTALGKATENALTLAQMISGRAPAPGVEKSAHAH